MSRKLMYQGWQPASGNCPAQICRVGSAGSPVLVLVEQGILIPRDEPKQAGQALP
ncbi:MAG TPA: hypothetical protein PLB25_07855 [Rhodoferax sp.]|nr:hypothetical protein [Rhodoferax sp.]